MGPTTDATGVIDSGSDARNTRRIRKTLSTAYGKRITVKLRYVALWLAFVAVWWMTFDWLSACVAGFGIALLAPSAGAARMAARSRRWNTTDAVVIESTVLTEDELRDRFGGLDTHGFSTSGGYVPFVRYEYTVDGERYANVRLSPFDGAVPRRRWAAGLVDDYPQNGHATVRYDPADPARSFLRVRTRSTRYLLVVGVSVGLLATAIWLLAGRPVAERLLVLPPLGFVGALLGLGLYRLRMALLSRRWPTTDGTVRGRGIRSSSGIGTTTAYYPKLRYEYEVDGTSYVSSRVAFGNWPKFRSRTDAESWLDEYPTDDRVTVHYDPAVPDRSVLEPRGALEALQVIAIGLALSVVLALMTGVLPVERLPF